MKITPVFVIIVGTLLVSCAEAARALKKGEAKKGAGKKKSGGKQARTVSASGKSCQSQPTGSAPINSFNIPDSLTTVKKGTTATGTFSAEFNPDLTQMSYTLTVTDANFKGDVSFVNTAALYCTADSAEGVALTSNLQVPSYGGKISGAISQGSLLDAKCGAIASVSTIAGLFEAVRQNDVTIIVDVTDYQTGRPAEIWGIPTITSLGGRTNIFASPASGCVKATAENVVCTGCTIDVTSYSTLEFSFAKDLSTITYSTKSDNPNLVANGYYFKSAGLFCGNPGQEGAQLAVLFVSTDGSLYSSGVLSSSLGFVAGATCGGKAINTVTAMQEAIGDGLVYYEVQTILGEIRGQLVLNKK